MKRSNKYRSKATKKRTGKALTISLLVSGIIMTGIVTWVGLNDWDIEKSIEKIETAIGLNIVSNGEQLEVSEEPEPEPVKELVPETNPQEKLELDGEVKEGDASETGSPSKQNKAEYIKGQKLPEEPTYIKDVLIVNKQHPLPEDYKLGESKDARNAFNEMAAEALLSDFNLHAFSTYRSFEYQTGLYDRYVERDGVEEADRYSARPGYSEHQSGLAFDIGEVNRESDWASARFGETEAGKWLASNAHRFGFIMRYPEGKEEITGYMHESWHFRYVGPEIAEEIYKENSTLEEYLGL